MIKLFMNDNLISSIVAENELSIIKSLEKLKFTSIVSVNIFAEQDNEGQMHFSVVDLDRCGANRIDYDEYIDFMKNHIVETLKNEEY